MPVKNPKEYYKAHYPVVKDALNGRRRERYARNRRRRRLENARWKKSNPGKVNAANSRRYATKKLAAHPGSSREEEIKLHLMASALTKQTGTKHHVDHIIPLASGGFHHHLNMQVLPALINLAKNDNPLWELSGYKSWRNVPRFLWPEALKPVYEQRS